MSNKVKKCCICGGYFTGWGNTPAPIKKRGECCDFCNCFVVVPARIALHREVQLEEPPMMKGGF